MIKAIPRMHCFQCLLKISNINLLFPLRSLQTFKHYQRIPKKYFEHINQIIDENYLKVSKFAEELDCKFEVAADMVRSDTRYVTSVSEEKITEMIRMMRSYGFKGEQIATCPRIFHKNPLSVKHRLETMQGIRNYNYQIYYLCCGEQTFKHYMDNLLKEGEIMGKHSSKTSYLAELFECKPSVIAKIVADGHDYLLTRPLSWTRNVVALLREHGFTTKEMIQNRYNRHTMMVFSKSGVGLDEKMSLIDKHNILDKSMIISLLLMHTDQCRKSVSLWAEDQEVLAGHSGTVDYLAARLQCSKKKIQSIFRAYTCLKARRALRFQEVLDILMLDIGLEREMILKRPTLLQYSNKRLLNRYDILKDNGVTQATDIVRYLCLSEKQFEQLFMESK